MNSRSSTRDPIERQARQRAGAKAGLYIHALVYVTVNLGLFVLNTVKGGPHWSWYPMFGWGLGLAIHALVVMLKLRGNGLSETLLAQERQRLLDQQRHADDAPARR